MNIRKYGLLVMKAQNLSLPISKTWNFLRKYHYFVSKTYLRVTLIAEKLDVKVDKPLVNLDFSEKETLLKRLFKRN